MNNRWLVADGSLPVEHEKTLACMIDQSSPERVIDTRMGAVFLTDEWSISMFSLSQE